MPTGQRDVTPFKHECRSGQQALVSQDDPDAGAAISVTIESAMPIADE